MELIKLVMVNFPHAKFKLFPPSLEMVETIEKTSLTVVNVTLAQKAHI
ncbi:hypothetical protein H6G27_03010 [Nostoc linckia FACHB-104]|nr:hypothetical protein [Nostoc linckia FACHB-104]